MHQIELFLKYPLEVQDELFKRLIERGATTEFGKKHNFKAIQNYEQYKQAVPISTYEDIYPYIQRLLKGEQNLLWPTEVKWFAKSSGTTNARSKFIPVSKEALEDCHFKGGKDLISIYVNNYPNTKLFNGKNLAIGGSHQPNEFNPKHSHYGDVSAVLMKNLPLWAQFIRTPKLETALLEDWEVKLDRMAKETVDENVTNIAGVPTWTIVLIQRILELKGKAQIKEIWPNLELFVHGAVAFGPYRPLFNSLGPPSDMRYLETYNASEGFFGIQDQKDSEELLLMLDYGIYYEFIPAEYYGQDDPPIYNLSEVEVGKNYAMIITTNAGLWRYSIGDTIKFTSTFPFRIKISGRTKHFINAFGEEVIVENAEQAITAACEATGAVITNFTAAPRYIQKGQKGGHEWILEFTKPPQDTDQFVQILDDTLRKINSDYDAKRQKDIALEAPKVHIVEPGTFYAWMKQRGKLGGQNKVPRLANNRDYLDSILKMLSEASS